MNSHFEGAEVSDDGMDYVHGLLDWIERHSDDRRALDGLKTAWERLSDTRAAAPFQGATWKEATEPPPRRWLINGWLPAGRLSLLWGVGGGGKSRLALQLAAGVASGGGQNREWIEDPEGALSLGEEVPETGCTVMYCSWEDEEEEFWRRLSEIAGVKRGSGPGPAPWVTPDRTANLHVFDLAEYGAVWSPLKGRHTSTIAEITPTGEAIRATAESIDARLLIMDPLAAVYLASENDRGLVRAFCASWDSWARRKNCAVWVLCHPNRSGEQSGSTDWRNASRAVWELSQEPHGARTEKKGPDERLLKWKLEFIKGNYGPPPKPLVMEMDMAGGPRWRVKTSWDAGGPRGRQRQQAAYHPPEATNGEFGGF